MLEVEVVVLIPLQITDLEEQVVRVGEAMGVILANLLEQGAHF
jgi:hypothetical protein